MRRADERGFELVRGERVIRWLEIPLGRNPGQRVPTWGALAERYHRCSRRVESYAGQRVRDRETLERIVIEAIETNLDLLVADHDELEELRRLRATADRLLATIEPGGV